MVVGGVYGVVAFASLGGILFGSDQGNWAGAITKIGFQKAFCLDNGWGSEHGECGNDSPTAAVRGLSCYKITTNNLATGICPDATANATACTPQDCSTCTLDPCTSTDCHVDPRPGCSGCGTPEFGEGGTMCTNCETEADSGCEGCKRSKDDCECHDACLSQSAQEWSSSFAGFIALGSGMMQFGAAFGALFVAPRICVNMR